MPEFRYPQFCPIARAAEIVGERWTILIVRELFFGQQRFSDLRRRLSEVSPSVLSERLTLLEQRGLVRKLTLAPPAASVVYELTEGGRGLGPVLMALAQWGSRFLLPIRPGEQLDPDRLRYGLGVYARTGPTPEIAIELRMRVGPGPAGRKDSRHLSSKRGRASAIGRLVDRGGGQTQRLVARGGAGGTTVSDVAADNAALVLEGTPLDLVALLLDTAAGRDALKRSKIKVLTGSQSPARVRALVAQLFDFAPAETDLA